MSEAARRQANTLLDEILPLKETPEAAALRQEFRAWLGVNLTGRFAPLIGRGGAWDEDVFDLNLEWERHLAAEGWACITWPQQHGGRSAGASELFAYRDEYFRAGAPERVTFLAEDLVGPTLMKHGTPEQVDRFLPRMLRAEDMWCQGYSEPGAGSDLANIRTRARLDDDQWVIEGQKIWTSLAARSDWCFALCRTEPGSTRSAGLSYLLVPMDQPGIEVRPIRQMTGSAEFAEVFFSSAVTAADNVVGKVGEGWSVAMATLGFERDWFMSRYFRFARDLAMTVDYLARTASDTRSFEERIVRSFTELAAFRAIGLQTLAAHEAGESASSLTSLTKLFGSTWHRDLGELAQSVLGSEGAQEHEEGTVEEALQRMFLYSRAEPIFAGTNEIQRDIIARRTLGLPSHKAGNR